MSHADFCVECDSDVAEGPSGLCHECEHQLHELDGGK